MKPIRNSAKALIIKDNKLLTLKKRDEQGCWYLLPGGGQEHGETLHDALRRECREEIDAEVIIDDLRFVRDYIGKHHEFADHDGEKHHMEFMFVCHLADGANVKAGSNPDDGQLAIEWLDLDRLDSYRLYPLALRPLIKSYADNATPIYLGDIN